MAERRMFTKKVTDDDNFMQLSSSAQALYLHLTMSADDDGFCNQVSISMFKAHASTQDLEALLKKRYLLQFQNGVIVIKHWRMANALRKDRYSPTAFKEELAQLQIKDNGSYSWLPDGCQMIAERLPQDSIDKNSIDKSSTGDMDRIADAWNSLGLSKVSKIASGTERYNLLNKRIKDYGVDKVLQAIENVRQSTFLMGGGNNGWTATFDWFIKPNNFPKVLDGNYADNEPKKKQYTTAADYKPPVKPVDGQSVWGMVDKI